MVAGMDADRLEGYITAPLRDAISVKATNGRTGTVKGNTNLTANCDEDICVSHTAGCGVPDTTPAPEIK